MKYSKLYNLIYYLQYGTKLHIGVIFLSNFGNDWVKLPHKQEIHFGSLCEKFKAKNFKKCFRCRSRAIYKAIKTGQDFGDVCINGIYEYTRPVVINEKVAAIIFIGNIYDHEKGYCRLKRNIDNCDLYINTLETDFDENKCKAVGAILESYICMLLENYRGKVEKHPAINNVKNYIEDNLEFDIKISQIAQLFHYNEQYFGRLFKTETGMSLNDYINQRRLKRACRLLLESNDTILAIANKSGFNSVSYFNRLFKKTHHLTPSEYRNKKGMV